MEHPSIVEKKIREIRQSVAAVKLALDGVFLDVSNTFKYLDNIKCNKEFMNTLMQLKLCYCIQTSLILIKFNIFFSCSWLSPRWS